MVDVESPWIWWEYKQNTKLKQDEKMQNKPKKCASQIFSLQSMKSKREKTQTFLSHFFTVVIRNLAVHREHKFPERKIIITIIMIKYWIMNENITANVSFSLFKRSRNRNLKNQFNFQSNRGEEWTKINKIWTKNKNSWRMGEKHKIKSTIREQG